MFLVFLVITCVVYLLWFAFQVVLLGLWFMVVILWWIIKIGARLMLHLLRALGHLAEWVLDRLFTGNDHAKI